MNIRENVPLSEYSTMRLGGTAHYLVEIESSSDLSEALAFAAEHNLKIVVVGTGSNIVWTDDGFDGLVIVNKISGVEVIEDTLQYSILQFGAGVPWDEAVVYATEQELTGIESLSLVPGTCGAAPVQNIGAYGQEVADTLESVEAYDTKTKQSITLDKADCNFRYRTSIFNNEAKGRYIITSIRLKLFKSKPQPPFYKDVDGYLSEHDIVGPTPAQLREAVMVIRTVKLPDPSTVANNGSFFRNPIVSPEIARDLIAQYPDLPNWEMNDGQFKLSAAWLIEEAGFPRGTHDDETGMATWKNQALVLVNESAKSSSDLITFRDKIISAVKKTFDIELKQEPEIVA